jgi:hypothetical protein
MFWRGHPHPSTIGVWISLSSCLRRRCIQWARPAPTVFRNCVLATEETAEPRMAHLLSRSGAR